MNDYSVTVKVRNGRILERMREVGIETQTELARRAGISVARVNTYVAMRESPKGLKGGWRLDVDRIAGVLRCDPQSLFTDRQIEAVKKNSVTTLMDEVSVSQLMDSSLERATWAKLEISKLLEEVSPREAFVVNVIKDGCSFEEAAEELAKQEYSKFPVSRERVRQIYKRALRKMRIASARQKKEASWNMLIDTHS